MCKVGDIIVVRNYLSQGQTIKRHSFVVLSTEHGEIQGMDFDLVCNVMSSFRSEEQRKRKMGYPGNFEYPADAENIRNGHGRSGYIKAEQLNCFNREKTDFYVLGNVEPELFNVLIEFINQLKDIEVITDNL